MKRVLFAGGGTAGHVVPVLPLIRTLAQEGVQMNFVGSRSGLEAELLAGQPVTLDIDIDAAGLVRRVAYDMDMGGLVSELAALEGAGDMGEVTMRYVLEVVFFDYDADIVVDVPADAVDVTDAFLGLVSTGV